MVFTKKKGLLAGYGREFEEVFMKDFLTDLIDNDTLLLAALFTLAVIEPGIRELVAGGLLGFWTKEAIK